MTITPVLFLLMFTYLFGGAVSGSTGEYLQYLLPGILVQSVLFTARLLRRRANTDMTKGVVDRFRSLPIWRPAPLVGAVLGDCVRFVLAATVVVLLGARHGLQRRRRASAACSPRCCSSSSSRSRCRGSSRRSASSLRSPSAVMNTGFMALFPLIFLSNIFVEPSTLPGWLEAFVDVNPMLAPRDRDARADGRRPGGGRHRPRARRGGVLTRSSRR